MCEEHLGHGHGGKLLALPPRRRGGKLLVLPPRRRSRLGPWLLMCIASGVGWYF